MKKLKPQQTAPPAGSKRALLAKGKNWHIQKKLHWARHNSFLFERGGYSFRNGGWETPRETVADTTHFFPAKFDHEPGTSTFQSFAMLQPLAIHVAALIPLDRTKLGSGWPLHKEPRGKVWPNFAKLDVAEGCVLLSAVATVFVVGVLFLCPFRMLYYHNVQCIYEIYVGTTGKGIEWYIELAKSKQVAGHFFLSFFRSLNIRQLQLLSTAGPDLQNAGRFGSSTLVTKILWWTGFYFVLKVGIEWCRYV